MMYLTRKTEHLMKNFFNLSTFRKKISMILKVKKIQFRERLDWKMARVAKHGDTI